MAEAERHAERHAERLRGAVGLADTMKRQGDWLFRWRGYVPAPLFLVVMTAGVWTGLAPRGLGVVEPWQMTGFALMLLGVVARVHAIGYASPCTSGGNTRRQVAEDLNTTGLYSVVRHPLYLGNALMWTGVALLSGSAFVVVGLLPWFAVHYERIILAEESFLAIKHGERFETWARETPTFLPALSKWRSPLRSFSWRAVLRREYSAVLALTVTATLVEVATAAHAGYGWTLTPGWLGLLAFGLVFYFGVRTLRRRRILEEPEAPATAGPVLP